MLALTSTSVKMSPERRARLKKAAHRVGCSVNLFMTQAVDSLLDMAEEPDYIRIPKFLVLIRSAHAYEAEPPQIPAPGSLILLEWQSWW